MICTVDGGAYRARPFFLYKKRINAKYRSVPTSLPSAPAPSSRFSRFLYSTRQSGLVTVTGSVRSIVPCKVMIIRDARKNASRPGSSERELVGEVRSSRRFIALAYGPDCKSVLASWYAAAGAALRYRGCFTSWGYNKVRIGRGIWTWTVSLQLSLFY